MEAKRGKIEAALQTTHVSSDGSHVAISSSTNFRMGSAMYSFRGPRLPLVGGENIVAVAERRPDGIFEVLALYVPATDVLIDHAGRAGYVIQAALGAAFVVFGLCFALVGIFENGAFDPFVLFGGFFALVGLGIIGMCVKSHTRASKAHRMLLATIGRSQR